jgi:hypothetical protein
VKRRTGARLIAIVITGYLFALLSVSGQASTLAHYRTLTHDALLKELAEKASGNFDNSFLLGLMIVALMVALVEGIMWLALQAMNRISPLPPAEPPEAASTSSELHFH